MQTKLKQYDIKRPIQFGLVQEGSITLPRNSTSAIEVVSESISCCQDIIVFFQH